MATLTFIFRPSARPGRHRGTLYIRIIHQRKSFTLSTGHRIYSEEWDGYHRTVIVPVRTSKRYGAVSRVRESLDSTQADFERTVDELGATGTFTMEDIRAAFRLRGSCISLGDFAQVVCSEIEARQPRTARAYASVVKSVHTFTGGREVLLSHIDRRLVEAYESYLKQKGLKMNTISFYMRNLRAIYRRALQRRLVASASVNPFAEVFTGIKRTEKKALDARQIHALVELAPGLVGLRTEDKARLSPPLRDSLALFLFCFFAQGMSFVDMAYLRKSDISGGVLRYRRKKTGQVIVVSLSREMKSIIDYFSSRTLTSDYVFPVITREGKQARLQYESALRLQNLRLKKLAAMTSAGDRLSTHVSRHSWATIAKNENVELAIISEALGHSNESTTRIYLDSFTRKLLDRANERIRRAIKKAV